MSKKKMTLLWLNCAVYFVILIWVVLFHATLQTLNSAFDPDYRAINFYPYFNGSESVLNMAIFAPLGVYIEVLFSNKTWMKKALLVLATTFLFELIQYVCAIGTTDIMDIINNSIGGFVGIALCYGVKKLLKLRFNRIVVPVATICTIIMVAVVLFVPLR